MLRGGWCEMEVRGAGEVNMSVWPRSHQATVNTLGPPAAAVSPPHLIGHNPLHVDQSDVMGVAVLQFYIKIF